MSSSDNLAPIVIALGAIVDQIKLLEAKKKELEAEVREALADKGKKQYGEYVISVTTSPGRKTLDKEALCADLALPDLSKWEKVGKPFTTMKIERVEQGE